jgi:hypothetical protein
MRRITITTAVLMILTHQAFAPTGVAQPPVQFPSAVQPPPGTPTFQPPSTYPYTSPSPTFSTPPTSTFPPPALPPATQPQAMQNLVGDAQRYGLPFDPYAQPAQYVGPAVPPPPAPAPYATPYTAAPPPASAPLFSFPALSPSWGGFYAGFEATILEARTGSISFPTGGAVTLGGVGGLGGTVLPATSIDFEPDFDFEFSPRVWAGYKGAAGFGVRGRWWYYDHSGGGNFDIEDLPEGDPVDLDGDLGVDDALALSLRSDLLMNVIDLEGTQDGQFHNWDFQVAGGVRYARIDYDQIGTIMGTFDGDLDPPGFTHELLALSEFSGIGPTIGFYGRRPLMFADGLAFLVGLRVAFLFGDSEASFVDEDVVASFPDAVKFEDSVQAWEAQIGFEYSRQLASGARLFGGAYLEGQVWEWGFPTGITGDDLGFFGPTVTVGIAR